MKSADIIFIVGVLLLVTNQPIGWGGMLLFGNLARKTGRRIYYFLGIAIYAASWLMLLAGVYLVGRDRAEAVMKNPAGRAATLATAIAAVSYYFWRKRSKKRAIGGDEPRKK